jgi:lipoprotein-anchoring transpeptidase ErfK/SrfK
MMDRRLIIRGLVLAATSALRLDGQPAGTMRAEPSRSVRVVVSLAQRRLWVLEGADTVRSASIAVASGDQLVYAGRAWRFVLPTGRYTVRGKREAPTWTPPDWHYAEVARDHTLRLRRLPDEGFQLHDGRWLVLRDSVVSLVTDGEAAPLPLNEHVVFQGTLFVPPLASRNRRLEGALGAYALDLGGGYLLHGTTDPSSIGTATTHGCIRLGPDDLAWLYHHVPVGALVEVR